MPSVASAVPGLVDSRKARKLDRHVVMAAIDTCMTVIAAACGPSARPVAPHVRHADTSLVWP